MPSGRHITSAISHTTPHEFMRNMKICLEEEGVEVLKNVEITDLKLEGGKIRKLYAGNREYQADEYVLAAGSWTPLISKKMGINMLLQAGKGLSDQLFSDLRGFNTPPYLRKQRQP